MKASTHVGTSGWQHKHWQPVFYPREMKSPEWLAYYARHFDCVEVGSSFYALPTTSAIASWCDCVPSDFTFAVTAPRRLTHFKKLKNCEADLDALFRRLDGFGQRLGPVLFRLPARWRCNLRRLEDFLANIPPALLLVFEFRDPSWHNNEIYGLLKSRSVGFCIFDSDGFTAPLVAEGNLIYLRLHGPSSAYAGNYRAPGLRLWVDRARAWNRQSKEVFLLFDNDEKGYAVKNATRTVGLLEAA